MTKDATRQAILDAAQRLFVRFGPIKTSVADIARELGMSPTNIYNFYASREAILEAIGATQIVALRDRIAADVDRAPDEWAKIRILFLATARYLRTHLDNEKDVMHLQALERRHQWRFIGDFHQFLRTTAEAVLRSGIENGRLNPLTPCRSVAALFDCMTTALDPLWMLRFEPAEHERRIAAQLDLLEQAFRLPVALTATLIPDRTLPHA